MSHLAAPSQAPERDRRIHRPDLPSCTGCGGTDVRVTTRTRTLLYLWCERCAFILHVPKPLPRGATRDGSLPGTRRALARADTT
jgi:hypothetical protein